MAPLVILLVIIGVVVAAKIFAKKLRSQISSWEQQASARGYELSLMHVGAPDLPHDLFTAVKDRKVWTTTTRPGSNDSAFLYKFELRSGDVDTKFRRTCALVELPFHAPKTTLRPHARQTLTSQPTDGADVTLDRVEFDAVLRLQTSDEGFARTLFGPELADWLLSSDARVGEVELEFRDGWLLCAGPKADDIDELIDFLEWAQRLRDRASAVFDGSTLG